MSEPLHDLAHIGHAELLTPFAQDSLGGRLPALQPQAHRVRPPRPRPHRERLDHVNLLARDVPPNREFAMDQLGFRLYEQIVGDDGSEQGAWMSLTIAAHELIYVADHARAAGRLHHLAFFVDTREEVLRAADLFLDAEVPIEAAPSKHAVAQGMFLPVLVRHSFPGRTGSMTGLYTTALIGFAALAAGITVPISKAAGGGWRTGLAIWAAPAAIAFVGWLLMPRDRAGQDDADSTPAGERLTGARSLTRSTLAWSVTLFFAIQSASFYATLAWLPSIYKSHGASDSRAGLLLSLSILVGVIAAPTVPAIAVRMREQRSLVVVFAVLTAVAWVGILVAPMSAPYLWSVLLGIGENATFPLALTLIVLRGGTVASTAALSTLVQTVGYLLAAVAPLGIGAIHDLSGSWTLPLIVLIALNLPQAVVGLAAGSDRKVPTSC